MTMTLKMASAPHLRLTERSAALSLDVLIALVPLCVFSFVHYGVRPVLLVLTGIVTAVVCELCLLYTSINKIDLPAARPEEVRHEIEDIIGIDASDAPLVSAKQGTNIEDVLEAVVKHVPPPAGDENAPLQALIFDSYYDSYKGVIVYIRVKEGRVRPGDTILMMATGARFDVVETGIMRPGDVYKRQG